MCGSLALNGLTGRQTRCLVLSPHGTHELSAFYDITQRVGLAILTPRWMNYVLSEQTRRQKFAQICLEMFLGIIEQEEGSSSEKVFKHCMITLWFVAFQ